MEHKNDIYRLKRISWKSKNNVYVLFSDIWKLDVDKIKSIDLDLIIINENSEFLLEKLKNIKAHKIYLRKIGENYVSDYGLIISHIEAIEISKNILDIDKIEVPDYVWAMSKISMELNNSDYYWKNILLLV